jgi:Fur family zinc uptake transcriptional regulator
MVSDGMAAGHDHDHDLCIDTALAAAAELCRRRGARFTPLRRRVLELVWGGHAPVGAYQVLDRLRHDGRPAAPPTVYRALDFLISQGLVHRLESLNAFIGCPRPDQRHRAQYLICERCGEAAEVEIAGLEGTIEAAAVAHDFQVSGQTVEVRGLCASCRGPAGG